MIAFSPFGFTKICTVISEPMIVYPDKTLPSAEFDERVNALLADGWSLHGPPVVVGIRLVYSLIQVATARKEDKAGQRLPVSGPTPTDTPVYLE